MKNKLLTTLLLVLSMAGQSTVQAQGAIGSTEAFYILSGFVLLVAIIVLVVAIIVLQVLRAFVKKELDQKAVEVGKEAVKEKSWWQKWLTKANAAVPVEKEATVMLDHDYDGIKELDNHLPPWWKWMFYISIVFAVVYMAVYHVFGTMPLQTEEYQTEMDIAEEARLARMADQPQSNVDENTVVFVDDAEALADGKQIFNTNCAACHKEDGGGGIGPNLTDNYWIHGGSIQDIFKVVKNGVPEKGMISWASMLTPDGIQNVASYIFTMKGTTPANPKEPQGDLYEPEENAESKTDSTEVVEGDTTRVASVD